MAKMGRPTDDSKQTRLYIRASETDKYKLQVIADKLNLSMAEVVRYLINEKYTELNK